MSDQERFDWDEDMDFENLADEHEVEDFSELDDAGDASPPEIDVTNTTMADSGKKNQSQSQRKGLGLSSAGLGLLFSVSTLVAGLGLGGAILYVGKLDPMTLWHPEGLTRVDQWFNFQVYPMNMLYLLAGGILILGVLGSWAIAQAVKSAQKRHDKAISVLDQITALRLDNEEPWQNPSFTNDPQIAAFVAETLGSWRLQMARQKKTTGLEGELRRLQKAMDSKSRDDMVGRFDNPFAGNLADSAVQLFDEAEVARNEARNIRDNDNSESAEILGIVQDARSWNRGIRDKLGAQGVAVEKLTSQLTELGSIVDSLAGNEDQSQVSAAVADITREVSAWSQGSNQGTELAQMNDLVDRGSKLAFQIAMEVARLGTRGERLLPMTQTLEELSNEFRQATSNLANTEGDEVQERIKSRLDQVQARLDKGSDDSSDKLSKMTKQMIPALSQVSKNLLDAAQNFNPQFDRLTGLGESISRFTGATFDPNNISAGNPDNPPEGGLNLTQHDPFASGVDLDENVVDVDPFSGSDDLLLTSDGNPEDSGFETSVTPQMEDFVADPEPVLPSEDEKVYDLVEFGAVPLDQPETAEAEEEKVYDLAEFGAVTLT
jgi:ElaB/YqjD/DUF883 family membrane-anchored ribosome-binding protein